MENNEVRLLKKIYVDVVKGFTETIFNNVSLVIKHLTVQDQSSLDDIYEKYYLHAINKSVPTEKEKSHFLSQNKLWLPKDDKVLRDSRLFIDNLIITKRSLARKLEIDSINQQIIEEEKKYNIKLKEKQELIGTTAESFANQKLNDFYLYNSFFKNQDFKQPYFSLQEFDNLDVDEFYSIEKTYFLVMNKFNSLNLKKIALTPFFQNIFYLCKDSVFDFYGKYIINLSLYQSELFSHGLYFKAVLERENPPQELLSSPDKLIDWISSTKNLKAQLETSKTGGVTTIVGATKEDLIAAGVTSNNNKSLITEAKGKSLNMEELIKLSE